MADLKGKFEDYTEAEFLAFVSDLCRANAVSEAEFHRWLEHFEEVTEHPEGTDLVYYPAPNSDSSAQGIVDAVKQWRAENGKPGFKTE